MSQYKFSIIIPHKNIPDLLQRCLDSIPLREDIQIIIVDDNSNPSFVDFKHFPGLDRPNVVIYFDKSGKGAGRARNIGLAHALGEWVLFSDADDYFIKDNLNELLCQDIRKYDVIAWPCIRKRKNGTVDIEDFSNFNKEKSLLYLMNEPWRKMVRKTLINDYQIRFQETPLSNDILFSKMVAYRCNSFMWFKESVYVWEYREGSLSSKYTGDRLIVALNVGLGVNKFLKSVKKTDYFDRTSYYLSLLWQQAPFKYWWYLLKIWRMFDWSEVQKANREACMMNNVDSNIFFQIKSILMVRLKHLVGF